MHEKELGNNPLTIWNDVEHQLYWLAPVKHHSDVAGSKLFKLVQNPKQIRAVWNNFFVFF